MDVAGGSGAVDPGTVQGIVLVRSTVVRTICTDREKVIQQWDSCTDPTILSSL